jgi:hypothetical protein
MKRKGAKKTVNPVLSSVYGAGGFSGPNKNTDVSKKAAFTLWGRNA